MLVLTIKTDNPEAEVGLFSGSQQVEYIKWQAHKELSQTIHLKIESALNGHGYKLQDLNGVVVFKGPGSFTGLRIGVSVANALAYSLRIAVVSSDSDKWISQGLEKLTKGLNEKIVLPHYGAEPHITQAKK